MRRHEGRDRRIGCLGEGRADALHAVDAYQLVPNLPDEQQGLERDENEVSAGGERTCADHRWDWSQRRRAILADFHDVHISVHCSVSSTVDGIYTAVTKYAYW
jgi:hypothetical protein